MFGWWSIPVLIVLGTVLWIGAGRWELELGPGCQARILAWKELQTRLFLRLRLMEPPEPDQE